MYCPGTLQYNNVLSHTQSCVFTSTRYSSTYRSCLHQHTNTLCVLHSQPPRLDVRHLLQTSTLCGHMRLHKVSLIFSKSVSSAVLHTHSLLQPHWQETFNTFRAPLQSTIYRFLCTAPQNVSLACYFTSWLPFFVLLQGPFVYHSYQVRSGRSQYLVPITAYFCTLRVGQLTTSIKPGARTAQRNVAICLSQWAEAGIIGCLGVADIKLTYVAVQESKHIVLITV
jgi:hypothetical protein